MKLITSVTLFAGALVAMPCVQAETLEVATTPVGVVKMTIPAGRTLVAPVFVNASDYQGVSTSITESGSSSTITFADSPFEANEFDAGANANYYIEVATGDSEGFAFDISSNTVNSVTVDYLLLTDYGLSETESMVIRKHVTVDSFFGDASVARRDNLQFYTPSGIVEVSHDGTTWDNGGLPIYPGTGFIVNLRADVEITSSGTVKNTKTIVPVFNDSGIINLVATASPVNVSFTDVNGNQLARRDSVRFFEPGTLAVIGEFTIDSDGNFVPESGTTLTEIPAGEPFVISSRSTINFELPAAYND